MVEKVVLCYSRYALQVQNLGGRELSFSTSVNTRYLLKVGEGGVSNQDKIIHDERFLGILLAARP